MYVYVLFHLGEVLIVHVSDTWKLHSSPHTVYIHITFS